MIRSVNVLQTIDERLNCDCVEIALDQNGRPLIACGMYQLQEGESSSSQDQKRTGSVALYCLNESCPRLQERNRIEVAGVFDMKWNQTASGLFMALACADGSLCITNEEMKLAHQHSVTDAFCLSADWIDASRLACSTSTGKISIVNLESTDSENREWLAHSFPHDGSGAEIWTISCGRLGASNGMVASGADDGRLKVWDIRQEDPAFQSRASAHGGDGVCSIQFHPTNEHCLLTGGYDGHIRVWDFRNLRSQLALTPSRLGGGVWTVKYGSNGQILAACMRGGFRVLSEKDWTTTAIYTEAPDEYWESLAYGVDWVDEKTIVGCSFYDRKLRLMTISD